ncbi:DUF1489 domain-containing protein [Sphingomonas naphthae]|uniref:DUF1489 domain-containing protein n=1 Tax=Sphingomonas naphthae TaxID=1813468 RepID=A0ABY7TPI7_9SPHN|nr:DUF1489 domain-containing protein [Sphingomonas naphthae]WCT73764.1 DUF1489 domain-containing protein [Sphingomonas naphthae]
MARAHIVKTMPPLNMTKVAVGCGDADALRRRIEGRAAAGEVAIHTRYRPTRHGEMIGGSLYWIVKHRLVARQEIVGFAEDEQGHCLIRLAATLVPVRQRPKRAHQGWRYLTPEDAPADFDGETDDLAAMPPRLIGALASLGLI